MTYVLAGLIVAIPAVWTLGISARLVDFRIDLAGRDTNEVFWDHSVKRLDPSRYNARGKVLLRWFWVSQAALIVALGIALWLLAREGLL